MFCSHILVYIDQLVAAGAKSYLFSPFHDMGAVFFLYAVQKRFGVVVLVVMDIGYNVVAGLVQGHRICGSKDAVICSERLLRMRVAAAIDSTKPSWSLVCSQHSFSLSV